MANDKYTILYARLSQMMVVKVSLTAIANQRLILEKYARKMALKI
jgi:hypothetical protein